MLFRSPIFFDGFYERQGNIIETPYIDLIFNGMGFNLKCFNRLNIIFKMNKCVEVKNIKIVNKIPINFYNEPKIYDFKKYIFNNYNLNQEKSKINEKKILFIERSGKREITNMSYVKQKLQGCNIEYIFLEKHSIRTQIEKYMNADIVIGVHGAGLAWCVFMKRNSLLIELYPGNSNTDNYIRWCNIAGVQYKRICVDITDGNENNFRKATVNLNNDQIKILKDNL